MWTPFYPVHRVSGFVNKSAESYDVPASNFAASATEGHRGGRASFFWHNSIVLNGKTSGKFILTHNTF